MAKKQQIILTHGTGVPALENVKLGEVLVRHAEDAKKAALYTPNNSEEAFIEFPSKDWVNAEIAKVDAGGINTTITALQDQVDAMDAAYKAADAKIREDFAAADADLKAAYEKADGELEAAFTAADGELNAAISGLDTRVETLEGTVVTNLETAKKYTDDKVKALADGVVKTNTEAIAKEVTDRENAVAGEKTAREQAISALTAIVDTKVAQTDYNNKVAEIEGDIDDLESILEGYSGQGSVKAAVDSKVAQADYNTKVGEIEDKFDAIEAEIGALNDTFATDDELATAKSELTAAIAKAKTTLTEASDVTEGVKVVKDATDPNNYTVTAVGLATAANLKSATDRLDVIEGNDAGKSIRTIAKEELAAQLLSGEADADFKTLQELAAWLEEHPEDAAAMNASIEQNAKDIAANKTAAEGAISALDTRVGTAESEIDALQAEDAQIRLDFVAADTAVRGEFAAADTALENKLNAEIAKKATTDALNGVDARLQTAEGEIDALQAADTTIRGEFAAADAKIREDFAAADTTLKNELNTEIAKKATTEALNGVDVRLQAVEGAYVKSVVVKNADGEVVQTYTPVNNVLDLTELVIDGGTYA